MVNSPKIKARIKQLGLNQSILANYMDLSRSSICLKINNLRPMTLDDAEKIAKVLNLCDHQFGEYFFA